MCACVFVCVRVCVCVCVCVCACVCVCSKQSTCLMLSGSCGCGGISFLSFRDRSKVSHCIVRRGPKRGLFVMKTGLSGMRRSRSRSLYIYINCAPTACRTPESLPYSNLGRWDSCWYSCSPRDHANKVNRLARSFLFLLL